MDYILSHPLMSLIITLGSFSFSIWLQKKSGGHSLLNPIVVAIAIVVTFISFSGIGYETYMQGANFIHFLLGPATVALAIPLYKQLQMIKKQARAVIVSILTACFISGAVAWFLANQMGAELNDDKAVGFSLGATCHGLGVAKAFQKSETAGVFSVLGMSLMGLVSGILMPFIILLFA